jgi:DNA-binding transcriptional LysR family regulator
MSKASPAITHLRSRPVAVGLRAFEAVARHLNFRAASDELALTQSAVSRQIQALEDEVGVPLFLRHTRAVELTSAGAQLLRTCCRRWSGWTHGAPDPPDRGAQERGHHHLGQFASMWLIPRAGGLPARHPDIDIRIDASDAAVDLETADVDLACATACPARSCAGAQRLFGEQLAVVASPWLLKSGQPIRRPADRPVHPDRGRRRTAPSTWSGCRWRRWFEPRACAGEPKRWLYFNYAHQIVQAALAGQGVALAACR